jgi:hypothetical protein
MWMGGLVPIGYNVTDRRLVVNQTEALRARWFRRLCRQSLCRGFWLKYMENGESLRSRKEGTPPYDFTWMWQELGVLGELFHSNASIIDAPRTVLCARRVRAFP